MRDPILADIHKKAALDRFAAKGAAFVLVAGVLTMSAPWLMQVPALHGVMGWLGCGPAMR